MRKPNNGLSSFRFSLPPLIIDASKTADFLHPPATDPRRHLPTFVWYISFSSSFIRIFWIADNHGGSVYICLLLYILFVQYMQTSHLAG